MGLPARPSQDAVWATSPGVDGNGNSLLGAPTSTKQQAGWAIEKPPVQYWNWWWNLMYQWQLYLDRRSEKSQMSKVTAAGAVAPALGASYYYFMDCTLGNQSITLPTPTSGTDDGMEIRVKRLDASANTITWTGTIEGQTNPTINNQYTEESVIAFQGSWYWRA